MCHNTPIHILFGTERHLEYLRPLERRLEASESNLELLTAPMVAEPAPGVIPPDECLGDLHFFFFALPATDRAIATACF